jgi:hypothetical protein
MYLSVFICIYMYPVCICTYMYVFVRICMYAISTEKMLSTLHDCAHDLGVRCLWIVCILYVFAYIMYVLVRRIKQYLYVNTCVCVCILFINDWQELFLYPKLQPGTATPFPWKCTAARMHTICASGACACIMDPWFREAPVLHQLLGHDFGQWTTRMMPSEKWVWNKVLNKVSLCALVNIFSATVQFQGTWLVCVWCNTKIYYTNTCK